MNTFLSANRSASGESRSQESHSQHSDNQGSGSELTLPVPLRGYADNSDDEGVWARKTILSFDGGGVRGFSSLLIVKRLMTRIRDIESHHLEGPVHSSVSYPWMGSDLRDAAGVDEPPNLSDRVDDFLPCHYFDYMVGTSTGGLAAIMLGRLRMTVDEALDQYAEFGNKVFGKPRWFHERSLLWYPRAKFSCRKTRDAFKSVVYRSIVSQRDNIQDYEASAAASAEPFKYREDRTRTMVMSFCIDREAGISCPYMWRSYDHQFDPETRDSNQWNPLNPDSAHTEKIWQVARATSAAPRYFECIKIGKKKFLDGGLSANNPSLAALREIKSQHQSIPALFLSVGTGKKRANCKRVHTPRDDIGEVLREFGRSETIDNVRRKQFIKKYLEIGRHAKDNLIDTEGDNGVNGWRSHAQAMGLKETFRLNVEDDLFQVSLDDWHPANTGQTTLDNIRNQTDAYLQKESVIRHIDSIARQVVDIRRARAHTERWELFAVDVDYYCRDGKCAVATHYSSRDRLRNHLEKSTKHRGMSPEEVEASLNSGRVVKVRKPINTGI
ncbi:acyl transferase/acyl hydrolase/lysophospholipase [Ilyonectria sp. MPI-CAGE-AT-0026]|nr:acyl transferase/acyl hydrolase/lysophospholipase [Ilyonectria sp. MPI-CAGE-AT-0026]